MTDEQIPAEATQPEPVQLEETTPAEVVEPTPEATPETPVEEPTPSAEPAPEVEEPENDAPIVPDDLTSYKGKYIALERIKTVTTDGLFYVVLFKSGATIRLPMVLLNSMVSNKPAETMGMGLSPNALKMMTVVDAVEVLLRTVYLLNVGEVEKFCGYLQTVVENNYSLATRLLWSGKNKHKLPLSEMNDVLLSHKDQTAELQKELNQEAAVNREIQRSRNV